MPGTEPGLFILSPQSSQVGAISVIVIPILLTLKLKFRVY